MFPSTWTISLCIVTFLPMTHWAEPSKNKCRICTVLQQSAARDVPIDPRIDLGEPERSRLPYCQERRTERVSGMGCNLPFHAGDKFGCRSSSSQCALAEKGAPSSATGPRWMGRWERCEVEAVAMLEESIFRSWGARCSVFGSSVLVALGLSDPSSLWSDDQWTKDQGEFAFGR